MRGLNLIPEVCHAENAADCPAVLDRLRRMNDALTRQDLDDAAIAYGLLKAALIVGAAVAVIALINWIIDNRKKGN